MLLSTNEDIRPDEKITVTFEADRQETLDAVVLRIAEDPQAEYRYRAGVKFIHRYRSQPDRIFKFILRMQSELNRTQ